MRGKFGFVPPLLALLVVVGWFLAQDERDGSSAPSVSSGVGKASMEAPSASLFQAGHAPDAEFVAGQEQIQQKASNGLETPHRVDDRKPSPHRLDVIHARLNREAPEGGVTVREDGTLVARLGGRFSSGSFARINGDGKIEVACFQDAQPAVDFMSNPAPSPPEEQESNVPEYQDR